MCGVYKPTNVISISYGEQEQDLPAYPSSSPAVTRVSAASKATAHPTAAYATAPSSPPRSPTAALGSRMSAPQKPTLAAPSSNRNPRPMIPPATLTTAKTRPAEVSVTSSLSRTTRPTPLRRTFRITTRRTLIIINGQYNSSNGLYNRNGRGIPDVAANGDNIAIYLGGQPTLEGGTSASSPIFAALVTRINEERIKVGKGRLRLAGPGNVTVVADANHRTCGLYQSDFVKPPGGVE
jgi:tripeptidyl-peptidase I